MARLVYSMIMSLDGYVADESGGFDWAAPAEDVHQFINDLARSIGTHLFGRRMYEVMAVWESMPGLADEPAADPGLRADLAGHRQGRVLDARSHPPPPAERGSSATSTRKRSGR